MPDGGPTADSRARSRFARTRDATDLLGQHRRGVLTGARVYGTTSYIVVEALMRLLQDEPAPGAFAPASARDAERFLDALRPVGIRWRIGTLEASAVS